MNHFLVRVGRSSFGRNFMPALCTFSTIAYVGVQFHMHDQLRKLLGAQSQSGQKEKISDKLRNLIEETFQSTKENGLCEEIKSVPSVPFLKLPPLKLKWFISSTLDPIQFGSTKLKTGLMIGLPSYFNFSSPDDIPDSTFIMREVSFFKTQGGWTLKRRETDKEDAQLLDQVDNEPPVMRKIDRTSNEGKEYIESLLLSDDAKRFSIAKELYTGDTYKSLLQLCIYFTSFLLAVSVSRASVALLKTKERHITHRLPAYCIAGIFGMGNYRFLTDASRSYFDQVSIDKAKAIGPNYVKGAEEYFAKRLIRNRVLGIDK